MREGVCVCADRYHVWERERSCVCARVCVLIGMWRRGVCVWERERGGVCVYCVCVYIYIYIYILIGMWERGVCEREKEMEWLCVCVCVMCNSVDHRRIYKDYSWPTALTGDDVHKLCPSSPDNSPTDTFSLFVKRSSGRHLTDHCEGMSLCRARLQQTEINVTLNLDRSALVWVRRSAGKQSDVGSSL